MLAYAQLPKVASGTIRRFENFPSKLVSARNVDVWLPRGYDASKEYAVLYMQDGQSLFDSSTVWNHQEWGVDETLQRLMDQQKIRDCIVVGIWNSGITRHNDYLPQKAFESLSPAEKDTILHAKRQGGQAVFTQYDIRSDAYLKFIVTELKPFIDSSFSTRRERAATFIAGSSMGGLISIYAICEYPNVFGGAACLSTHWPGIFRNYDNPFPAAMLHYLAGNLPNPRRHTIYFDHGTETLDSMYQPYQQEADALMKKRGFNKKRWMTREYKGADHSERSWNSRLEIPTVFLMGT